MYGFPFHYDCLEQLELYKPIRFLGFKSHIVFLWILCYLETKHWKISSLRPPFCSLNRIPQTFKYSYRGKSPNLVNFSCTYIVLWGEHMDVPIVSHSPNAINWKCRSQIKHKLVQNIVIKRQKGFLLILNSIAMVTYQTYILLLY